MLKRKAFSVIITKRNGLIMTGGEYQYIRRNFPRYIIYHGRGVDKRGGENMKDESKESNPTAWQRRRMGHTGHKRMLGSM